LLHTSDWHIGRTFHGYNLLGDQEATLAAIADLVTEHSVDVVVVAGDLYDRALPSADAVQLATRALRRIRQAGAEIVISTGNHDSAPRLGAFNDFLAAGGLHIRSSIADLADPVLLADEHGPVAVYGIPYLEPDVARHVMGIPQVQGHAAVLTEAMSRVRADLAGQPAGTRSVVLAHAFVVGGAASDSERCIDTEHAPGGSRRSSTNAGPSVAPDCRSEFKVGTVGSVPAQVFAGVDYVALGHLHRRQELAPNLRYSGSPLPFSFSEAGYRKGAWLVDLDQTGLVEVRGVDLPVIRELATVRGELTDILSGYAELSEHYVAFELTDEIRPVDAMRRLKERFPFAVKLEWTPAGVATTGPNYLLSRQGVPDADLIESFVQDCRGLGLSSGEQTLVIRALTHIRVAEAVR
jgi:exonuclease SbcD